jgi:peptidoglycan biosynthesis protein MviN/MurJ (putative lipid II flippase)
LPLPKVTESFLFKLVLLFAFVWLSIACLSFFGRFFSFSFSLWLLNMCVVNALIKGEIESLCGSRTGGWSLPGVMND